MDIIQEPNLLRSTYIHNYKHIPIKKPYQNEIQDLSNGYYTRCSTM